MANYMCWRSREFDVDYSVILPEFICKYNEETPEFGCGERIYIPILHCLVNYFTVSLEIANLGNSIIIKVEPNPPNGSFAKNLNFLKNTR